MKYLLLLILPILLLGCEAETKQVTNRYDLPPELEDCKIFRLSPEKGITLYTIRCGYEVTVVTKQGKSTTYTTTISNPNKELQNGNK